MHTEATPHHVETAALLRLLRGTRVSGRRWLALCPAHPDRRPSLAIAEGWTGVLVHCFAGCRPDDVLAAVGLTFADLAYDRAGRSSGGDRSTHPHSSGGER